MAASAEESSLRRGVIHAIALAAPPTRGATAQEATGAKETKSAVAG